MGNVPVQSAGAPRSSGVHHKHRSRPKNSSRSHEKKPVQVSSREEALKKLFNLKLLLQRRMALECWRNVVQDLKLKAATVKLQALYRGHAVRKEVKEMKAKLAREGKVKDLADVISKAGVLSRQRNLYDCLNRLTSYHSEKVSFRACDNRIERSDHALGETVQCDLI